MSRISSQEKAKRLKVLTNTLKSFNDEALALELHVVSHLTSMAILQLSIDAIKGEQQRNKSQ